MEAYKYQLQPYRRNSDRHECPSCGQKKSFTYYVDADGNPLNEKVGRCNSESHCGYHYTPKEYFRDNPDIDKPTYTPIIKKEVVRKDNCSFIDTLLIDEFRSNESELYNYLITVYPKQRVNESFDMYRIGAYKGMTIFPQIDEKGNLRSGKMIKYKSDGHREKESNYTVDWLHSMLIRCGRLDANWELSQCLFGAHLIKEGKAVRVVESEKTALIMSIEQPQYIWVATSGKQFKDDKLNVLDPRHTVIIPDKDAVNEWKKKQFSGWMIDASCYKGRICEYNADIADITLSIKSKTPLTEPQLFTILTDEEYAAIECQFIEQFSNETNIMNNNTIHNKGYFFAPQFNDIPLTVAKDSDENKLVFLDDNLANALGYDNVNELVDENPDYKSYINDWILYDWEDNDSMQMAA